MAWVHTTMFSFDDLQGDGVRLDDSIDAERGCNYLSVSTLSKTHNLIITSLINDADTARDLAAAAWEWANRREIREASAAVDGP